MTYVDDFDNSQPVFPVEKHPVIAYPQAVNGQRMVVQFFNAGFRRRILRQILNSFPTRVQRPFVELPLNF